MEGFTVLLGELTLLKRPYYAKQSAGSLQSPYQNSKGAVHRIRTHDPGFYGVRPCERASRSHSEP